MVLRLKNFGPKDDGPRIQKTRQAWAADTTYLHRPRRLIVPTSGHPAVPQPRAHLLPCEGAWSCMPGTRCQLTRAHKKRYHLSPTFSRGRLAQLARALRLHRRCRGFESLIAHFDASPCDTVLCFAGFSFLFFVRGLFFENSIPHLATALSWKRGGGHRRRFDTRKPPVECRAFAPRNRRGCHRPLLVSLRASGSLHRFAT